MTLTDKYKCENCGKEHCKQINFLFETKQWLCFECIEKRLKAEKEAKNK